MTVDPFAAYRPKPLQPTIEEDPFAAYRPKIQEAEEEKEESTLSNIGRQIGRSTARAAETALGAPRAFGEFLESLVPEKALLGAAEKVGLGEGAKFLLETTKKYAPYKHLFPSSEQVRELNRSLFGKKIEPQTEWERKADDLVSDFTALSLPIPGKEAKLLKPFLLSVGGNVASDIVGRMGGTEKEQTYAKLGTFLVGSLFNPRGAERFRNDLYAQARAHRGPDSMINAQNFQKKIQNFRTQLKKGGSAGSKSQALKKLDEMENAIQKGNIEIEELEKFKQSINEARASLYEEFKGNKIGRNLAKANLDRVSKIVDDSLKEYGKINPAWEAYYRPANEAHGAIAQSQKVRNAISRNLGKIVPHLTLGLFGLGPTATKTVEGLAAGYGALEAGALLSRIYKSPTLRKYYRGVIQNALRDDAVAMRENLKKLEDSLSQD